MIFWMDPTDRFYTLLKLNENDLKYSSKMMKLMFKKNYKNAINIDKIFLESWTIMISLG